MLTSMVNGLSSVVGYVYDDANRLTSVGGVPYTWDNNGNLLNDGAKTYIYDSANRLTTVNGPSSTVHFAYRCNGESIGQFGCESDRVSQTVNGVTTNYVLDSASPLTQVLQDGTNTYVYGVDRIAQMNGTTPEYFLTDGLGSVRQLADSNGAVILAKNYDPYGTETGFVGSGLSSYGFTGEMTDSTGLLYLRARYYESGMGRFLTRDTWEGDLNSPMSFNLWVYGYGNPVNHTDPTGMWPCAVDIDALGMGWSDQDVKRRVDIAEKYVPYSLVDTYVGAGTYVAAGIAIQCAGTNLNTEPLFSGSGIAQTSYAQAWTPWGEPFYELDPACGDMFSGCAFPVYDEHGNLIIGKGKGWKIRGYGLWCEDDKKLKRALNPNNTKDAVELMKRQIKLVIDACEEKGCTSTDKFIAAALAQNGPGFNIENIRKDLKKQPANPEEIRLPWRDYFGRNGNAVDTSVQLTRFVGVMKELKRRDWYVPYVNWSTIDALTKIGD